MGLETRLGTLQDLHTPSPHSLTRVPSSCSRFGWQVRREQSVGSMDEQAQAPHWQDTQGSLSPMFLLVT